MDNTQHSRRADVRSLDSRLPICMQQPSPADEDSIDYLPTFILNSSPEAFCASAWPGHITGRREGGCGRLAIR
eukprot:scaffold8243_cov129-Isochrysis_galbana.AAC.6